VGSHTIGIDVGSQSIKGCLLDPDGDVLAVGREGCAMHHPASGWAEQDPAEWQAGLASVVGQMLERAGVAGIFTDRPKAALHLEGGAPWPLPGRKFGAVVVTNYLHRPLIPTLIESLSAGGVLIYETFMRGNERFGKPSNPDFLLKDGELLDVVCGRFSVTAYEARIISEPHMAMVQRIAARKLSIPADQAHSR